jgi:hypothetical protein
VVWFVGMERESNRDGMSDVCIVRCVFSVMTGEKRCGQEMAGNVTFKYHVIAPKNRGTW